MAIDIRHLRQVEALVKHRNFARAARALGISQPALSQNIRALEKQLDLKLFDRNVREVKPTVFGKRIQELGKSILTDTRHLERELALLKGLEIGGFTVGTGPLPAEIFLGNAFARLYTEHPKLKIRVLLERPRPLLKMLLGGDIDIMIADIRTIEDQGVLDIVELPEFSARYACCPTHPLTGKKGVKLKDIFDFPIAIPWLPEAVIKALAELAGLPVKSTSKLSNGIIECQYFKVLIETIKASDAIGLGLEPIFQDAVNNGDLVYLPIFTPQITSQFGIVSMKGYSLPPAVEAFQQYVIKAARESNLLFGGS